MSRTLEQELEGFDAALPLAQARTIPSRWYLSPVIADAERARVFGESWQLAARTDQLVTPGSFVTTTIAGEPVLVLRDAERSLRAFFNVCRHRAACVVTDSQGQATRLRCRYHGWTYDLQGRLLGAPEFDGVRDFRREDNGLVPVAVDVWGPLVFVHLGRAPLPLSQALAPLPERMGPIGGFRFVARRNYELACNWKVFTDNYLDGGYHVNSVHPSLAGVLQYAQYKTHCFDSTVLQTSPIRDGGHEADDGTSAVRSGETAFYGWAFPNFMVNVYAGAMDTNVVLPLGPERCTVDIDFYVAESEAMGDGTFVAESVEVGHRIQLEDVGVCEDVQRGLGSKAYDTGRYSVRRENGVHHFHRLCAARLRGLQAKDEAEEPAGATSSPPRRKVASGKRPPRRTK
jgi:choline monooxygenase